MLKLENIWKGILTSTIGAGLMGLAIYGWYFQEPPTERLSNTEAAIVFCLGFVLLGLRGSLEDALKKVLIELPMKLLKKFFGNDGPTVPPAATILLFLMLASAYSYGQINVSKVRITTTPTNDNALTQVLVRDATNGEVKYKTSASFGSGAYWPLVGSANLGGDINIADNGTQTAITIGSLIDPIESWSIFASDAFTINSSTVASITGGAGSLNVTATDIEFNASTGKQIELNGDVELTKETTGSQLFGSTYTPTITNGTNVAASNAPNVSLYTRVGNLVTVYFWITVDVTAGGISSDLEITIPVASNFSATNNLFGGGMTAITENIQVLADQATDRAFITYTTSVTTNQVITGHFMYIVM